MWFNSIQFVEYKTSQLNHFFKVKEFLEGGREVYHFVRIPKEEAYKGFVKMLKKGDSFVLNELAKEEELTPSAMPFFITEEFYSDKIDGRMR